MAISIIIPTLNEEDNIRKLLNNLKNRSEEHTSELQSQR